MVLKEFIAAIRAVAIQYPCPKKGANALLRHSLAAALLRAEPRGNRTMQVFEHLLGYRGVA